MLLIVQFGTQILQVWVYCFLLSSGKTMKVILFNKNINSNLQCNDRANTFRSLSNLTLLKCKIHTLVIVTIYCYNSCCYNINIQVDQQKLLLPNEPLNFDCHERVFLEVLSVLGSKIAGCTYLRIITILHQLNYNDKT